MTLSRSVLILLSLTLSSAAQHTLSNTANSTSITPAKTKKKIKLSKGAIVGIVITALATLVILILLVVLLRRRNKKKAMANASSSEEQSMAPIAQSGAPPAGWSMGVQNRVPIPPQQAYTLNGPAPATQGGWAGQNPNY